MIKRNAQYTKAQLESAAILPDGAYPAHFVRRVRLLLDQAEHLLDVAPKGAAGFLVVDGKGKPLSHPPNPGAFCEAREARLGPAWPLGPDLDGHLIKTLVRRFGRHGVKLWEGPNRMLDPNIPNR